MARAGRGGPPAVELHGPPHVDVPRTYVVLGMPRGGTSMVGGLVRLCGLPMGVGLPVNHEDREFNFDALSAAGADPVPAIIATIARRDAAYDVWGWKYPRATRYLDAVRDHLREPHLIVVLRDPVAAAGRHVQRGGEAAASVLGQHRQQCDNLDLVARWQVPTLVVSYESRRRPPDQAGRPAGGVPGVARARRPQAGPRVRPARHVPAAAVTVHKTVHAQVAECLTR